MQGEDMNDVHVRKKSCQTHRFLNWKHDVWLGQNVAIWRLSCCESIMRRPGVG